MLMEYIEKAMHHAKYEILQDDNTFYGEIPECKGVYSNADNLEDCRKELQEVLEDWILFRIYKNLSLSSQKRYRKRATFSNIKTSWNK